MKHLLLVHGAIGASDQLIPLMNLLKSDVVVHLLELEGHGASAGVNTPFSLERFVAQMSEAMEAIGEPVHIFGYSMGGFVALLNAAEGKSNIASVITLGTKMAWDGEIAIREVRNLDPEIISEKVPKFAQALHERHGDHWQAVLKRTADFMMELGVVQPISEDRMSDIDVPVLLCLADQDKMVSTEETRKVHEWIANSRIETIPESKHPIEQVNLTALAGAIRSFIQLIE